MPPRQPKLAISDMCASLDQPFIVFTCHPLNLVYGRVCYKYNIITLVVGDTVPMETFITK